MFLRSRQQSRPTPTSNAVEACISQADPNGFCIEYINKSIGKSDLLLSVFLKKELEQRHTVPLFPCFLLYYIYYINYLIYQSIGGGILNTGSIMLVHCMFTKLIQAISYSLNHSEDTVAGSVRPVMSNHML